MCRSNRSCKASNSHVDEQICLAAFASSEGAGEKNSPDLGPCRWRALALFGPKRNAEPGRATPLPLTCFAVIRCLHHRANTRCNHGHSVLNPTRHCRISRGSNRMICRMFLSSGKDHTVLCPLSEAPPSKMSVKKDSSKAVCSLVLFSRHQLRSYDQQLNAIQNFSLCTRSTIFDVCALCRSNDSI